MATAEQIAELRALINEPDNTEPFTDTYLGLLLDKESGNTNRAASAVWRSKASSYAELVDVQEGSSKRSLSNLYKQALAMAEHYQSEGGDDGPGGVLGRSSRTRRIERV